MALAALALVGLAALGGCARPAPPQEVVVVPARRGAVVERSPAIACTTTSLVIATVSRCGEGGLKFGVAAE
jgi:hypothetical protein